MTFGDKDNIFFEFKPNGSSGLQNMKFIMNNLLISREPIYTPSYEAALQRFIDKLHINKGRLWNPKFNSLTDEELFEHLADNSLEDDTQYLRHSWTIDETLDQYSIMVFEQGTKYLILWKCWDVNNCNSDHELNRVYRVSIDQGLLIKIVDELISCFKGRKTTRQQ